MRGGDNQGEGLWRKLSSVWPLAFALIATLVFGYLTWSLAVEVVDFDGEELTRYEHFLLGRPNELGDTLAGFVGSLTLIWVVASVLQQSMELRAQRREFVGMVRAQDAQVLALEAQAKIFEDEKRRRDEEYEGRLFRELLTQLQWVMRQLRNEGPSWRFYPLAKSGAPDQPSKLISVFAPFGEFSMTREIEADFFPYEIRNLQYALSEFFEDRRAPSFGDSVPSQRYTRPPLLDEAIHVCERLNSISGKLSESDRVRYDRFKIIEFSCAFSAIRDDPSLWLVGDTQ